jgi:O-antigen/teichoic acid export membrane protein
MSEIKKLFKHSGQYGISQVLSVLAGFISFPILTRTLSVDEYGIMCLVMSSIMIITPITKLGLSHSSIRYYAEFDSNKKNDSISYFYNTSFWGSLVSTSVIIFLFFVVYILTSNNFVDPKLSKYVIIIIILVFLHSLQKLLMTFLRAEQKSLSFCIVMLVQRYGTLIFGLLCLIFLLKSLYGYFIGAIVGDLLILIFLLYDFSRKTEIHWRFISIEFFIKSVKYGLPVIGFETITQLISFSDRFLIQHFLSLEALGTYSACNNIVRYVSLILSVPITLAIMPICMNIWTKQGKKQTKEFLSLSLRYFCLISFPLAFGVMAVGKDLVILLASEKYSEAHIIIPYVIIGKVLFASCNIICVPLYLYKKTLSLLILFVISFVGYIILNFFLIQHHGILGAAYTTLITNIMLFIFVLYLSFKYLRFRIDYFHIILYFIISWNMYIFVPMINPFETLFFNLLLKIFAGIIIYFTPIVLLDKTIRVLLKNYLYNVQIKFANHIGK